MKRIFTSLLLVLAGLFMFATLSVQPVKAETDLIDLYPNEDVNNLKGTWQLKLGIRFCWLSISYS